MPPVTDFYQTRRKIAWAFAVGFAILFFIQVSLGLEEERFLRPQISRGSAGLLLAIRAFVPGDLSSLETRVLPLDPGLPPLAISEFAGDAGAVLVEKDRTTTYFGTSATVLRDGKQTRTELGQTWEVLDAVMDPGSGDAWIFGWQDGKILARRRSGDGYSPAQVVAESKKGVRIATGMTGSRGPLVAWKDAEAPLVRTALFDGSGFALRGEFEVAATDFWDPVPVGDRVILVSYRREDRTQDAVTLRLRCCRECGQPPPPETVSFRDPGFLFGRSVTGLSAAIAGETLIVALTRETVVQTARAPSATMLPEAGSRLEPIGSEPLWRRIGGSLLPMVLLFCALSLVFLGISMFRERTRLLAGKTLPASPPWLADIPQRAMAHLLDTFLVMPPTLLVVREVFSRLAEAAEFEDLRYWAIVGLCCAVKSIYHTAMEYGLGWSVGKGIMGLRVTGLDGSRPPLLGTLARNLVRELEMVMLLGVLVMANTRRRQRLGDLLGRTVVVQDRPAPEAEPAAPAGAV